MDFALILKAGFMAFALCLGVLLLVFYLLGAMLGVSRRKFVRVFLLAAVISFVAEYVYLHYKVPMDDPIRSQVFLVGSIGGWLAGIFFGLTNLRRFLANSLK